MILMKLSNLVFICSLSLGKSGLRVVVESGVVELIMVVIEFRTLRKLCFCLVSDQYTG